MVHQVTTLYCHSEAALIICVVADRLAQTITDHDGKGCH